MSYEAAENVSLEELEMAYKQEVATDKRAAAETAYALAFRYRNEDVGGTRRFDIARTWAQHAVDLLDSLPSDSVAQVASLRSSIGGIPIPDLLHSGVVRERLNDVFI
ncbi:MAG TPA: hypothetical protein VGJ45_02200 [Pseudonocardiaceae bacterium]|jgi:hypothetical protein